MLRSRAQHPHIGVGDVVIVYEGFSRLKRVLVTPGKVFANSDGPYHHDDMVGKSWGAKLRPCTAQPGSGGVYLLRPTPELITNAVTHRTQIIYTPDISMICLGLDLQPGCVVLETGTGSGSVSHSIVAAIAPTGHLYTFDFHEVRLAAARQEFAEHGIGTFVTATHADAIKPWAPALGAGDDLAVPDPTPGTPSDGGTDPHDRSTAPFAIDKHREPFGLPPCCLDAAFLDLPAPHLAMANVLPLLKPNAAVCNFSPCIEQVSRVCEFFRANDFTDIRTVEVLQRPYCIRPVRLPTADTAIAGKKRPRPQPKPRPKNGASRDEDAEAEDDPDDAEAADGAGEAGAGAAPRCGQPVKTHRGHTGYLTFARRLPK